LANERQFDFFHARSTSSLKERQFMPKKIFSVTWTLAAVATGAMLAQTEPPVDQSRQISEAIAQMDAKTFAAFNTHNVDLLMSMFTPDVEFYHDKGGLTNYEQTREGFTTMFGNTPDIRRELVKDSLHVYPIKGFGAIEVGTHRFCHKEHGKDDCGSFPFVMVWKQVDGAWKISRVISYGH